jgi:hypothetical protein
MVHRIGGVSGVFFTRWEVSTADTLFCIRVRTQARGPFSGLTAAELTTFRATNAPATPTATPTPTP